MTREHYKGQRFSVYDPGYCGCQLRDNRASLAPGYSGTQSIIAVFPTIGGGFATGQTHRQAVRLAKRLARALNKPA